MKKTQIASFTLILAPRCQEGLGNTEVSPNTQEYLSLQLNLARWVVLIWKMNLYIYLNYMH